MATKNLNLALTISLKQESGGTTIPIVQPPFNVTLEVDNASNYMERTIPPNTTGFTLISGAITENTAIIVIPTYGDNDDDSEYGRITLTLAGAAMLSLVTDLGMIAVPTGATSMTGENLDPNNSVHLQIITYLKA